VRLFLACNYATSSGNDSFNKKEHNRQEQNINRTCAEAGSSEGSKPIMNLELDLVPYAILEIFREAATHLKNAHCKVDCKVDKDLNGRTIQFEY